MKSVLATLLIALTALLLGCSEQAADNANITMTAAAASEAEPAAVATAHVHVTPGETCFICDPAKREEGRLWCKEHGRYEDRCFLCHPELEGKDRLYCTEHFLYEDECFLCHPELAEEPDAEESAAEEPVAAAPAGARSEVASAAVDSAGTALFASRADRSDILNALFCREHGVNENECGICHPELIGSLAVGEGLKVRLESIDSARKAGVRLGYASAAPPVVGAQALGELTFNRNKLAVVSPVADGIIQHVLVDVGDTVEEGQLLAEVSAPAIADAKSAFVKALVDLERTRKTYEREKGLMERKITAEQDYEQARAAYDATASEVERARQQLFNLGLSKAEVEEVHSSRSTSSTLPLRAPFAGTIVERDAVMGTAVQTGAELFQVADLETMWFELSVPETSAAGLAPGVDVVAEFDALPGETFAGEITWVSAKVNEATRMVNVRATLANPEYRLKSGFFGRAILAETAAPSGLTVPSDAVQTVDGRSVVFAKLEDDLYETRLVTTGQTVGDRLVINAGLTPQDQIAVAEAYLLKSELLKARLGAGCVDE